MSCIGIDKYNENFVVRFGENMKSNSDLYKSSFWIEDIPTSMVSSIVFVENSARQLSNNCLSKKAWLWKRSMRTSLKESKLFGKPWSTLKLLDS